MKKLRIKRLLIFLEGLFILAFSSFHFIKNINFNIKIQNYVNILLKFFESRVSYLILFIISLSLFIDFFMMRRKKLFFSKTEYGDFSISLDALVDMVEHSIENYVGINYKNIRVKSNKLGILVYCTIDIATGSDIPHTVSLIQQTISDYIQKCTGLTVQSVKIKVKKSKSEDAKIYTSNDSAVDILKDNETIKNTEKDIDNENTSQVNIENK